MLDLKKLLIQQQQQNYPFYKLIDKISPHFWFLGVFFDNFFLSSLNRLKAY